MNQIQYFFGILNQFKVLWFCICFRIYMRERRDKLLEDSLNLSNKECYDAFKHQKRNVLIIVKLQDALNLDQKVWSLDVDQACHS